MGLNPVFLRFNEKTTQFFYHILPKIQTPKTSNIAEKGRTTMPRVRSAQARLTMKRLVAPRIFLVMRTAAITMMLPKITTKQIRPRGTSDPITLGSSKSMLSVAEEQFRM